MVKVSVVTCSKTHSSRQNCSAMEQMISHRIVAYMLGPYCVTAACPSPLSKPHLTSVQRTNLLRSDEACIYLGHHDVRRTLVLHTLMAATWAG